jgi:hypothetical protein
MYLSSFKGIVNVALQHLFSYEYFKSFRGVLMTENAINQIKVTVMGMGYAPLHFEYITDLVATQFRIFYLLSESQR